MAKAKTKVPKRVGGIKVPKKVRKQAKKTLKLVEAPAVREFAIAGLTAAAEALVERTSNQLRAAGERQRKATLDTLDLGDMLRQAAIEGARRFLAGFEEARREPAAATTPKPARKRKAAAKPAAQAKPAARTRKATGRAAGRSGGSAAAPE